MSRPSFWSTVPGILTALAGLLTAAGSLAGALYSAGIIGRKRDAPTAAETPAIPESTVAKPTSTATPAPVTRLRREPATLSGGAIDAMLLNHGFYDKARNPVGKASRTNMNRGPSVVPPSCWIAPWG